MYAKLTPAAKRDLKRLQAGWSGSGIRSGPMRQLLAAGYIEDGKGWGVILTDAGSWAGQ